MSVLGDLRALAPRRRLTLTEAYGIAERQAMLLLRLRGVTAPAVPTDVITRLPFVQVATRVPMQSSAATRWMKPRWVVLVNGLEPAGRQKFSLGHEVKHVIDHADLDINHGPETPTRQRQLEQLCDYFAGCLWMPKTWLKQAYADGVQDVVELAELFEVSAQAMQVRLVQTGLVDRYARCATSEIDNAYLRSQPASPLGQAA